MKMVRVVLSTCLVLGGLFYLSSSVAASSPPCRVHQHYAGCNQDPQGCYWGGYDTLCDNKHIGKGECCLKDLGQNQDRLSVDRPQRAMEGRGSDA